MGADIGKNVCLYPNGADPPMTEPDLVTIQDNACVDDASLVCHINSRVRIPGYGDCMHCVRQIDVSSGASLEHSCWCINHL